MTPRRLLARILRGDVGNVAFVDLVRLIEALGFEEIGGRGSHRTRADRSGRVDQFAGREGRREALSSPTGRLVGSTLQFGVGEGPMMQSYPIEVFWNDEDQIWIADVPDLPFCSGHGPTPHEAVQEAEIGVEAWLAAAQAEGREVPVPSRRSVRA